MKTIAILGAVAALLAGACLLAAVGREPPALLLAGEVAFFTLLGGVAGFAGRRPRLPRWAASRPVAGAVLVTLGVGAVYVPAQFVVSSLLLGAGMRLLWLSGGDPSPATSRDLDQFGAAPSPPAVIDRGVATCRATATDTPSRRRP